MGKAEKLAGSKAERKTRDELSRWLPRYFGHRGIQNQKVGGGAYAYSRPTGQADVEGFPVRVEVKSGKAPPLWPAVRQIEGDARKVGDRRPRLVVIDHAEHGVIWAMRPEHFGPMLRAWDVIDRVEVIETARTASDYADIGEGTSKT